MFLSKFRKLERKVCKLLSARHDKPLTVHSFDQFKKETSGIGCLSDLSQLNAVISDQGDVSESTS